MDALGTTTHEENYRKEEPTPKREATRGEVERTVEKST